MSTKSNPGKFDCYKAADDDEPIFTLRANDPLAPLMVEIWARMSRFHKIHKHERIEQAFYIAENMKRWKDKQPDENNASAKFD